MRLDKGDQGCWAEEDHQGTEVTLARSLKERELAMQISGKGRPGSVT